MLDRIRFELTASPGERGAGKQMATNFFLDLMLYLNADPYQVLKRLNPTPQEVGIIYTLRNRIDKNELGRLTLHKQEMNGKDPFCVYAVEPLRKQADDECGVLIFWNIKRKIPTSTTLWTNFGGDLTLLDIRGLLQKPKNGSEVKNIWGITSSDIEITVLNRGDIIDQTLTHTTKTRIRKTRWRYSFLGELSQSHTPANPNYFLWIEEHRAKIFDGHKKTHPLSQISLRSIDIPVTI